jgi:predicted phage terminase large subunit-like protein
MTDISIEEYADIISTDRLAFTEEVFNQIGSGEYIDNWHVHCIVEHLQALDDGELEYDNLIINMPPRLMKTISISIADSAWSLGQDPSEQIICASHSLKIGKEINGKCLDVMQSDVYKCAFPDTILTKQTEEWFKTSEQGHRLVATVGNKVTGFGATRLYIDDPVDPESALSEAERERANRWIPSTLFGRANDQNTIKKILVMQRLHENDPSGMFLEKGGWHHLCLPAKFHRKFIIEVRGKNWEKDEGEYLFPQKLGKESLDRLHRDMGPYSFSGQYLQNPAPIGGGEFKVRWIKHYDNLSADFSAQGMNVYMMIDPASGKKNRKNMKSQYKELDQDYTAMMVVGLHSDRNYYLLDMVRDRLNPTERINTLFKLHMKWNKLSGKSPKVVYEEYGMQSDAFYIKKTQGELNYRFPFITVGGRMMKEDRIRRLIPLFENERFYLPKRINYTTVKGEVIELVKELIDNEMVTFPVAKHDDMMDAMSRIMEEDVYAQFPGHNLVIHRVGEDYRDELLDGYKEENCMSW